MLVFSNARLVFLAVPKTGSTAYAAALGEMASVVIRDPPELKHAPLFRYNRYFRPALERFAGGPLDIVAVMREPVEWLGSWYRYRSRPAIAGQPNSTRDITFDEFVRAYLRRPQPAFANVGSQAKFLEPLKNGTAVTHLFRHADSRGLDAFLESRLETKVETARLNASPGMELSLSAELDTRLRRSIADDFKLFDGIGTAGAYTPLSGH